MFIGHLLEYEARLSTNTKQAKRTALYHQTQGKDKNESIIDKFVIDYGHSPFFHHLKVHSK
jgi:hypothetical protein